MRRGIGRGRRHTGGAPGAAGGRCRRSRRRTEGQHAHRFQYARHAVRVSQPPHPDHAPGGGGFRFRTQPRGRRQDHVVERCGAALEPSRFQRALHRRRRGRLAHRLRRPRPLLRQNRARGRCLREPRSPRGPSRRHLPAARADEVQRPDREARRGHTRRQGHSRAQGDPHGGVGRASGVPLLRQLHGGVRCSGEVQFRGRTHVSRLRAPPANSRSSPIRLCAR